jgi:hypothetical protein
MRYGLFAVYDAQVKTFMRPFYGRTVGEAERTFGDAVRNPESDWAKHPQDYSLFKLGEFDDESGLLVSEVAPVQCCLALQFAPIENLSNPTVVYERDGARKVVV